MGETKILIVEDSSIVALDIKRCLISLDYQVSEVCSTGAAALQSIQTVPPDLVLMDINLKGDMDGIVTAQRIKELYNLPVIYLTAYSDRETLTRAKITEPFGYIIKPFEERELHTSIEMALYRYQMSRKLTESEKWLATTLRSIGDAVIATDQHARIKLMNPVAEKLTGWTQAEAVGLELDEVFKIINESTRNPVVSPARKVLEHGMVMGLANHTLLISKTGEEIPIDDSAAPIKDDQGQITGVVLVFRDIVERKRSEQTLLQSEARYRAVVEQSADGIYLADVSTKKIIEANRSLSRLLKYPPDEIANLTLYDFIADSPTNIDNIIQDLLDGKGPVYMERRYWRKDGKIVEVQASSGVITYAKRQVLCVVVRDISERKRMDVALHLTKAKIKMLLNAIPDLMLRVSDNGKILDYKLATGIQVTFITEDIFNKNLYDILLPELVDQYRDFLRKALESKEVQVFEYEFMPENEVIFHEVRVIPGLANETMLIIRDITERKQMEFQLTFLSMHDRLTGIYNRTFFEEKLNQFKQDFHPPVGIIICDLDGLKLVNDTLGHQKGDELLIAAAEVIREALRPVDLVFRIGGDEFAALMEGSDQQEVEQACQKIQHGVDRYNLKNTSLPLSISYGFAVCDGVNENLETLFKEADDNMYREKLYRSQSTRSTIVQAMMKVLEVKDFITEGHANRLQDLVYRMAVSLKLPEPEVINLRLLAQFHDIGKVGTPDRVLFKNGPLDEEELAEIQRHAEIGHRIANAIPDLLVISDNILKHHEWWNGAGYPLGLKGEEIPLGCRILAIADAYDAMTSDRPYRKALPHGKAVDEIRRCAGTQFDPLLAEKFIQILDQKREHQTEL